MKVGDVILVPFPFADMEVRKVRPALVIAFTKDQFQNAIICAISSSVPVPLGAYEVSLSADSKNHLKVPSVIKCDRITTIRNSLILQGLGEVNPTIMEAVQEDLVRLFTQPHAK